MADPRRWLPLLLLAAGLAACSSGSVRDGGPATSPVDISKIPDAVPRYEPRTRAGNPPSYRINGRTYRVLSDSAGYRERGVASWYGTKFHGRSTSNGEPYDMYGMSAAHKTLPIPSYVRVTNLLNKRTVVVRVNDRGPFVDDRVIDLSYAAAAKLDMLTIGTAPVEVIAVGPGDTLPGPSFAKTPEVWIQAGAFTVRDNAERLRARLAAAAITAVEVRQADVGGRAFYKVRLGPVASTAEADRVARILAAYGIPEPLFVID
ncbi:MAG: septal ring lytic transglycosylase RlpA family protein [Gammaproteobacteria bacterium]|nr:septal ring lytic transglycosylase RlpA family protein [Gammaproteobacteria bacterium]